MVCEPGRKSGYDRIGLLLQLAQIHAEYLGNRSFSREGARDKRARFGEKITQPRRGNRRDFFKISRKSCKDFSCCSSSDPRRSGRSQHLPYEILAVVKNLLAQGLGVGVQRVCGETV
jgi:hypothetical protein